MPDSHTLHTGVWSEQYEANRVFYHTIFNLSKILASPLKIKTGQLSPFPCPHLKPLDNLRLNDYNIKKKEKGSKK